jgi:hypothetical protein
LSERIPCRVSAELREHQRKLDKADARTFDPWDSALMQDLFGRLAEPMALFLIAFEQIEKTEQSFGPDKSRAFDFIRPRLTALKDACLEEFRQL